MQTHPFPESTRTATAKYPSTHSPEDIVLEILSSTQSVLSVREMGWRHLLPDNKLLVERGRVVPSPLVLLPVVAAHHPSLLVRLHRDGFGLNGRIGSISMPRI